MLLEHGEGKGVPTMIMVCQPCRIAATALRTWLQLTMEEKVGLRLEDGVRVWKQLYSLYSQTASYSILLSSPLKNAALTGEGRDSRHETLDRF